MVGGQFWRHRMDTIQTLHVQPDHPAIMGVKPFKAYDETYLHEKLQADNNVLAVRDIKADQAKDKPDQKTEPVYLDPYTRQRPDFLHGIRTRRAHLEPAGISGSDGKRHSVGRW